MQETLWVTRELYLEVTHYCDLTRLGFTLPDSEILRECASGTKEGQKRQFEQSVKSKDLSTTSAGVTICIHVGSMEASQAQVLVVNVICIMVDLADGPEL